MRNHHINERFSDGTVHHRRKEDERRAKERIERRRIGRWERADALLKERRQVDGEGLLRKGPLRLQRCTPPEGWNRRDLSIHPLTLPRRLLDLKVLLRDTK